MTRRSTNTTARLDELFLEQAINGLDETQIDELDSLLGTGAPDNNPYMETAALVQLGLASMDTANSSNRMPANLRQKLLRNAPGGGQSADPADK